MFDSLFSLIFGSILQIFAIFVGALARFCLDFFILKLISSKLFDHFQNVSVSFNIESYIPYESPVFHLFIYELSVFVWLACD